MNKSAFLILALIAFTYANPAGPGGGDPQCHNSCATCNVNVCLSCNTEHAKVDPKRRACVCDDGYYSESLNPLVCKEKISGQEQDCCERSIAVNMYNFQVNTECYFKTKDSNESLVISDVTINTDHSMFDESCRGDVVTEIQYRPKGYNNGHEDQNYILFPLKYVFALPGGKSGDKRIKIPLIDIYDLAFDQSISNDGSQIVQHVYFRIMIGFVRKFIRAHRWIMTVYTNRQQVQTFIIDVDIQRTESCQDGQECIIIADLDVTGNQYESNWNNVRGNNQYIVGDWMYMKIWFKDSTYTKQLSFQKLYFKNEQGQVFDHTSLTDPAQTKWNSGDKTLHVKLRLIEPGVGAVVQVNMLIEMLNARFLQSTEQTNVKQQFKADVSLAPPTTQDANQDSTQKASSLMMFFGLINLLAMLFLY